MATYEELKNIYDEVGERRGWDFSQMNTEREPLPWDYMDVVRRYVRPSDYVLDVGTGGGERFLKLSQNFAKGLGVDRSPQMIETAQENAQAASNSNLTFEIRHADSLNCADQIFDAVLTRHAPVFPREIVRVLKPNGYFMTQQVARLNRQNFKDIFSYYPVAEPPNDKETLIREFQDLGCRIVATGEFNVHYWIQDLPSLIFWFKGRDFPPNFSIETRWQQINEILTLYSTPRGILTNEHRELLVVCKG